MTAESATLWAAVIAAVASLFSLFFANRAARSTEARSARRALLANMLSELGALLYELIALSKKMTQMKKDEKFEIVRKQADATAQRVDGLRRKARYALWGIDDGLRTIQWMPACVAHNKDIRSEERAAKLIKLGTSLRKSMDSAIMHAYMYSSPPTKLQSAIVWVRARRLRKYFDDGKPASN